MRWILRPYEQSTDFYGRTSRKEYWLFQLWLFVLYLIFEISTSLYESDIFQISYLIFLILHTLPDLAITSRRLHDTDKSGAWIFISLVPIVGAIVLIIFTLLPSTSGPNRYDEITLSDKPKWWDTFPWWGIAIVAILFYMGYQIVTNDSYELAWDRIIPGVSITIVATLQAFAVALALGLLAGMGQLTNNVIIRNVARTYVEFIRGIPILPLIFTVALVLIPEIQNAFGFKLSFQTRATVTLAFIYGAYMAEIFRGGIQSIAIGQVEAGRSLGLSRRQTMNSIVLPQAMRAIIPPLGNDFIAILKDTSLLSVLGVLEVTQRARQFSASTFKFREGYFVLAFIYLILTLSLSLLLGVLERRMTRDDKGVRSNRGID